MRGLVTYLQALAASYGDKFTNITCDKCGMTRQLRQPQKFVPEGQPREYLEPDDVGCPRCFPKLKKYYA